LKSSCAKTTASAISVLKKYTADNDNYTATKATCRKRILLPAMLTRALKYCRKKLKNKPYATGIYATLGNQYYNQQQYAKAEECYLACVKIAPTISSYYASLGKINEMTGNQKDKAVELLPQGPGH
jgi:tetratricopeptide (TPR) repeat protein